MHLDKSFLRDHGITDRKEGLAFQFHFNNKMRDFLRRGHEGNPIDIDTEPGRTLAKQYADELLRDMLKNGTHSETYYNHPSMPGWRERNPPVRGPGQSTEEDYLAGNVDYGRDGVYGSGYTVDRQGRPLPGPIHRGRGSRGSSAPVQTVSTRGRRGGGRPVYTPRRRPQGQGQGGGPRYDDGGVDVSRLPPWHPLRIRAEGRVDPKERPEGYGEVRDAPRKQKLGGDKRAAAREARDRTYKEYLYMGFSEQEARQAAQKEYRHVLEMQYSGIQ